MSGVSSHRYETVYIVRPTVGDSGVETIKSKVESVVKKFNGAVQEFDDWGNREMAYTIKKSHTGRYQVVVYNGDKGVVEEIERHFRISDDVIRFLTVAVPEEYQYGKLIKNIRAMEEEMKRNREARMKEGYGRGKDRDNRDFDGEPRKRRDS